MCGRDRLDARPGLSQAPDLEALPKAGQAPLGGINMLVVGRISGSQSRFCWQFLTERDVQMKIFKTLAYSAMVLLTATVGCQSSVDQPTAPGQSDSESMDSVESGDPGTAVGTNGAAAKTAAKEATDDTARQDGNFQLDIDVGEDGVGVNVGEETVGVNVDDNGVDVQVGEDGVGVDVGDNGVDVQVGPGSNSRSESRGPVEN